MSVITLTTDFGIQEPYVAMTKGVCLQVAEACRVIDISHQVAPYAIGQAAYLVRQAYPSFSANTLHLVLVHLFDRPEPRLLLARFREHWFVVPDNGLLSLLFQPLPEVVHEIGSYSGGFQELLACVRKGVLHWHAQDAPDTWAKVASRVEERMWLHPTVTAHQIKGNVVHIDRFGNAVVNIHQILFEEVGIGRPFQFHFRPHERITRISTQYADVPEGQPLLLFNAAGFLEIAVRTGQAASLLNLHLDDAVQLDFLQP